MCGLGTSCVLAQSADGFTVQKRGGIALVKPQPWSNNAEAIVMEFQSFTDRTVKGTPGAGYFEFHNQQGNKRQVAASKVVELFVYPQASDYPKIQDDADRQALDRILQKIKNLSATYPASRTYLTAPAKEITAEIAQYEAGKIKIDGKWLARAQHQREKARELAGQLKVDIVRAKPVRTFDLENDPRFASLQELGATDATIEPMIKELLDFYKKTERNEQRQALLQKLSSPDTSPTAAQLAITTLKTLKPEEDPRTVAFLKQWETSTQVRQQLDQEIQRVTADIEASFKDLKNPQTPPPLPQKVSDDIAALNKRIRDYRVTNPPPQLDAPKKVSRALTAFEVEFPKLQQQFGEKKLFDAKSTLDDFAPLALDIGPNTAAWVDSLKEFTQKKTETFSKLRDEAKLLANSGKPLEAIAKYEEAYAIIPDPDVAQQIALLKPAP